MMNVSFTFNLTQRVKLPTNEEGVIDSLAVDSGGEKAYVVTKNGTGYWWYLKDLQPA